MSNYCAKIWEAYKAVDMAHAEAAAGLVVLNTYEEIVSAESLNAKLSEQIDVLQETWNRSFEILPNGQKLFGPEWEALSSISTLNPHFPHYDTIEGIESDSGISPDGHITELNLSSEYVIDISFLRFLPHLVCLLAQTVQLTDFSEIGYLHDLKDLQLFGSSVNNIAFVSKLINLENIGLRDTKVADISPLVQLPSLYEVNLQDCPNIKNYTPLLNMPALRNIRLSHHLLPKAVIEGLVSKGVKINA